MCFSPEMSFLPTVYWLAKSNSDHNARDVHERSWSSYSSPEHTWCYHCVYCQILPGAGAEAALKNISSFKKKLGNAKSIFWASQRFLLAKWAVWSQSCPCDLHLWLSVQAPLSRSIKHLYISILLNTYTGALKHPAQKEVCKMCQIIQTLSTLLWWGVTACKWRKSKVYMEFWYCRIFAFQ